MWLCLETFLVVTIGGGEVGATGAWRVEAREAAEHPTCTGLPPTTKNVCA